MKSNYSGSGQHDDSENSEKPHPGQLQDLNQHERYALIKRAILAEIEKCQKARGQKAVYRHPNGGIAIVRQNSVTIITKRKQTTEGEGHV